MPPQATWLRPRLDTVTRVPAGPLATLVERALTGRGDGALWPMDLPDPAVEGRLVVLGAFGSGKTEISRRLGAALGVPVVPLRVVARAPDPDRALADALGGRDVAILDGLDEIGRPHEAGAPEFFARVTRGLRRWVLTSRPGHVRTEASARDPGQLDCFDLPLVEIAPYPLPEGAPAFCAENPVLLSFWLRGARGDRPDRLVEAHLAPTGALDALEALAWRAFVDPEASPESASFSAADIAPLPRDLFVEDLDGRWRFGHRSLYDALVARRLVRRLAAGQGGGPDDLTGLALSGAMRVFAAGPFPGWSYDEDYVYVPRGNFISGGSRSADERPLVVKHQPTGVRIARRAVTNRAFQAFHDACGPRPFSLEYLCHWRAIRCPERLLDQPVMNLRPEDADAFAAWAGARLPTADEWEKAARGWDGRHFPWGDAFDAALANTGASDRPGPDPVGSHPQGSGLDAVIGDVFEYTSSWYRGRRDRGRVAMGGAWTHPALRASLRLSHTLSGRLRCGLRLALDAP